ncbi:hypothetical protein C8U37_1317 [Trichococcus patagoniensis]|uniref:Uncharacterized protein n=1 Tax=Trichococcus patagoniensis TaxID=382641 RepID=A0A2T5I8J7_9LACT|nr:hypothetical protein [Trichococcus patagoniensis]PTQ80141.1 hypothetical protein C8U37_1317 [Trichococcus patagoniensis]
MKETEQQHLLVNLDKKKMMDPARLTWEGDSSVEGMSHTHPQLGNPFQYVFFQLLMKEWKGDRIALVVDSKEVREYLLKQEHYTFYQSYTKKLLRRVREEAGISVISIDPSEIIRWKKAWDGFINQFVLINYDSHLFMTIDTRLFKRTKNVMPYFVLAQAEERTDDNGSWAGDRIGIEPIDTATFDTHDYFEMFRMIGDKSACQLGIEDFHRRHGG